MSYCSLQRVLANVDSSQTGGVSPLTKSRDNQEKNQIAFSDVMLTSILFIFVQCLAHVHLNSWTENVFKSVTFNKQASLLCIDTEYNSYVWILFNPQIKDRQRARMTTTGRGKERGSVKEWAWNLTWFGSYVMWFFVLFVSVLRELQSVWTAILHYSVWIPTPRFLAVTAVLYEWGLFCTPASHRHLLQG